MKAVGVDNDILLKATAYGVLDELLSLLLEDRAGIAVLGSAPYVVRSRLVKLALANELDALLTKLDERLSSVGLLEPEEQDLALAAEIELIAQRTSLDLDSGESQRFAMLIRDRLVRVATGDKRAVSSLSSLIVSLGTGGSLFKKVICLEQIVLRAIAGGMAVALRVAVCARPLVDKTLSICFLCHSSPWNSQDTVEALLSYVTDLRKGTGGLLADR